MGFLEASRREILGGCNKKTPASHADVAISASRGCGTGVCQWQLLGEFENLKEITVRLQSKWPKSESQAFPVAYLRDS
jgi:hypothetical protein